MAVTKKQLEEAISILMTQVGTINERTKTLTIKDRERKKEIKEIEKQLKLLNKMELSNKELICIECGFCTYGYKDMVEHLAQYVEEEDYDRIPEENCTTKRIKLGKKRLN